MGVFRNWLNLQEIAASAQSGLKVSSDGAPASPTNASQNSSQIAGTALQDKSNTGDITGITQANSEGRASKARDLITKMSQKAINQFPGQAEKRNVALAPVGSQIEKSLGFDKYFKGMSMMRKEDVSPVPPLFTTPKKMSPAQDIKNIAKEFKPITKGTSVGRALSAAKGPSGVKPPTPSKMLS